MHSRAWKSMEVWIRRPKLCTEKVCLSCLAAHFSCRHETESDEAGTCKRFTSQMLRATSHASSAEFYTLSPCRICMLYVYSYNPFKSVSKLNLENIAPRSEIFRHEHVRRCHVSQSGHTAGIPMNKQRWTSLIFKNCKQTTLYGLCSNKYSDSKARRIVWKPHGSSKKSVSLCGSCHAQCTKADCSILRHTVAYCSFEIVGQYGKMDSLYTCTLVTRCGTVITVHPSFSPQKLFAVLDANVQPHRQDPTKASNDFALDGVEHILTQRSEWHLVF